MDLYTTDAIPVSSSPPIRKAWLVSARDQVSDEHAVSALEERAASEGADAIVGLRIAMSQSESDRGFGWTFLAYGTAVKR
ncbi:YbjQ family protein [Streptomyces sp. NBC_01142]|uniref:heavy metal-binding domain-containing protein n=1 Tax=Streptomyces sp. NBC_01142 TaxID=2975865 RepID=UPI0022564195|nr:heavy metal-binding domain-containing protein [Streptomyces sp. NBC_01142]MCX4824882.1 YbjQ family protein [Streptomyces sp. NBC_01142]